MCNSNATMSLPSISIHIHCMCTYMYIYVRIYWVLSVTLIRSGVNVRCAQDFPFVCYALVCLNLHDINQALQEVINLPKRPPIAHWCT